MDSWDFYDETGRYRTSIKLPRSFNYRDIEEALGHEGHDTYIGKIKRDKPWICGLYGNVDNPIGHLECDKLKKDCGLLVKE